MTQSHDDVETALALDENVLGGFGKAFLGYLYAVLPGWPVGVGDVVAVATPPRCKPVVHRRAILLILDVMIGEAGSWTGPPNANTISPAYHRLDSVRVAAHAGANVHSGRSPGHAFPSSSSSGSA